MTDKQEKVTIIHKMKKQALLWQELFPEITQEWENGKSFLTIAQEYNAKYCLSYAFAGSTLETKDNSNPELKPVPIQDLMRSANAAVIGIPKSYHEASLTGLITDKSIIETIKDQYFNGGGIQKARIRGLMKRKKEQHFWFESGKMIVGNNELVIPSDGGLIYRLMLTDFFRYRKGNKKSNVKNKFILKTIGAIKDYQDDFTTSVRLKSAYQFFQKQNKLPSAPQYDEFGNIREFLDENSLLLNETKIIQKFMSEIPWEIEGVTNHTKRTLPSILNVAEKVLDLISLEKKCTEPYKYTSDILNIAYFDANQIITGKTLMEKIRQKY